MTNIRIIITAAAAALAAFVAAAQPATAGWLSDLGKAAVGWPTEEPAMWAGQLVGAKTRAEEERWEADFRGRVAEAYGGNYYEAYWQERGRQIGETARVEEARVEAARRAYEARIDEIETEAYWVEARRRTREAWGLEEHEPLTRHHPKEKWEAQHAAAKKPAPRS